MKHLIFKIFDLITLPLALLYPEKLSQKMANFKHNLYASFIRHRFKRAGKINVAGMPIHIHGARFMELGNQVELGCHSRICAVSKFGESQTFTPQLILGNHVVIQTLCHIGCIDKVTIGDYTTMGARVYITDHTHGTTDLADLLVPPRKRKLFSRGPVKIGKHVHIGENSCIMPGVSIGDYSVIGANSVVTRDIPAFSIAVGSPAKVIRQYSQDEVQTLNI